MMNQTNQDIFTRFREKLKMTTKDAADALDVTEMTIMRWEKGNSRTPKMAVLAMRHLSERAKTKGIKS